ncbi:MAG: radical SAM protein [Vicinamibacteria bacterium]|nr:radical SAM protein [Vicinamibacteria bacterium]
MRPRELRVLILHASSRCDQACGHCSIWKPKAGGPELGVGARLAIIQEAHSLGARAVLFTGGEPLLCDHLETLSRTAHDLGLSVQIATNGLGLARATAWIGGVVDEVYVSLEGPEGIHDSVRGLGMFARLAASLAAVEALPLRPRLVGRSVLSAANVSQIEETVGAARSLGLDAISFLPVDVTSQAFGGDPARRENLRPDGPAIAAMRGAVIRLDTAGDLGNYVVEDLRKLTSLADGLVSGTARQEAPACNAPEWSSVVEADGAVRPCFFQPKVAAESSVSIGEIRRSEAYAQALRALGPENPTCAACACPKYQSEGLVSSWVGEALRRATPKFFARLRGAA